MALRWQPKPGQETRLWPSRRALSISASLKFGLVLFLRQNAKHNLAWAQIPHWIVSIQCTSKGVISQIYGSFHSNSTGGAESGNPQSMALRARGVAFETEKEPAMRQFPVSIRFVNNIAKLPGAPAWVRRQIATKPEITTADSAHALGRGHVVWSDIKDSRWRIA